jgi:hypothetical protein
MANMTGEPIDVSGKGSRAKAKTVRRFDWLASRLWLQTIAVCLPVIGLLLVGIRLAFPLTDDAWLMLLIKEAGHGAIMPALPNRPLFGLVLAAVSGSRGIYLWGGMLSNLALWMLMALQAAMLWQWIHPDEEEFGPAIAVLAVSPLVVLTQLTTYTVTVPINLVMTLGYTGFFLVARPERLSGTAFRVRLIAAAAALAVAGLFSEYAAGTAIVACALLLSQTAGRPAAERRPYILGAGAILAGALAGTILFRLTADLSSIPQNSYEGGLRILWQERFELPFLVLTAFWRALVGAVLFAGGQIRFSWYEKSTLAEALGMAGAAALCWLFQLSRKLSVASDASPGRLSWLGYMVALSAGLLPVILRSPSVGVAGPDSHVEEYGTRMYLIAMPIAACTTIAMLRQLCQRQYQWVGMAIIGFVAGYATFQHVWLTYGNRQTVNQLALLVKPFVESNSDMTLVVTSEYLGRDYQVTGQATESWTANLSRRAWFIWEGKLKSRMGYAMDRGGKCPATVVADIFALGVRRKGVFTRLLYVDSTGSPPAIEPYCVGPAAAASVR